MTPNQLPLLPEPDLGYIETDKSRQPAFSARQMREALAQQAQDPSVPHLFEFWWEAHMPQSTQAEAWSSWQSAQSSNNVAVGAQAQEPVAAVLGDIVALWDLYAPSQHMTAMHMHAKRALAGQQPVSPDLRRWCAYVGGMVAHWVMSEPNAHVRLGDDQFEAAIAGIIERRLWAMPKRDTTPQPQPAPPVPAPVDERCSNADDIRASGWSVAVHNDYRLHGLAHTFWLFTKGGLAVKGEGRTDSDALNQVRGAIHALQSPAPQTKGQP